MQSPSEKSQHPTAFPSRSPARLLRFSLTVTALLAVLHFYIGWQLLPALSLSSLGWVCGLVFLALSMLLIPLGMLARFFVSNQRWSDLITWAGSLAMGLFSSLLVLTLLRQILLVLSLPFIFASALLVPLLALLITLIGFVNARCLPRVVDVEIPLVHLPLSLVGFTIVQISDIHVGPTIKRDYVQAIVERVNSLSADLVAITGDVVDGSVPQLAAHTRPLANLLARHGVYFVTGNHEYYSGADAWVEEFKRLGLRVLMNEHIVLEHSGAQLVVAGVTDFSAHLFDPDQRSDPQQALSGAPDGVFRLLLAHQPRSVSAAVEAGVDLQLSGHTHGGQFWPWNLFVRLQQPYTAGLHRLGKLWIYISRGTGYWGPPKRFGAPSEITRIRLVSAASS
ncbi:MAG: metallophosphoesterase [Formivibrio sp.]|nr:metallophosphoesterase [Formivibrio sp.]